MTKSILTTFILNRLDFTSKWFYHCYPNRRSSFVDIRVIGRNLMHPEATILTHLSLFQWSKPSIFYIFWNSSFVPKKIWSHIGRHLIDRNIIQIITEMSPSKSLILNSINTYFYENDIILNDNKIIGLDCKNSFNF